MKLNGQPYCGWQEPLYQSVELSENLTKPTFLVDHPQYIFTFLNQEALPLMYISHYMPILLGLHFDFTVLFLFFRVPNLYISLLWWSSSIDASELGNTILPKIIRRLRVFFHEGMKGPLYLTYRAEHFVQLRMLKRVHQLKSKPASAFIAYSNFFSRCSLLRHRQKHVIYGVENNT